MSPIPLTAGNYHRGRDIEHNARAFPFLGASQEGVKRASPQGRLPSQIKVLEIVSLPQIKKILICTLLMQNP